MAVLLDTSTVRPSEREEAVRAAFMTTEVPQQVILDRSFGEPRHRVEAWELAAGAHVLRSTGTGQRVIRNAKHLRLAAPERVAISMQLGTGYFREPTNQRVESGNLILVDQTSLYDYEWRGIGGAKAFIVDYALLDVPVDVVRRAVPRLASSPVYDLFRAHLQAMNDMDHQLAPGPALNMVSDATTELLRALITTAADDGSRQREALENTLYGRITRYILGHLGDHGLTAEKIARAHFISVRHLYVVWSVNDTPLREWIMMARLQAARRDLGSMTSAEMSVAAISRKWGFRHPSHFSRRFRAAYGVTPREFQADHRA